jgi:2-(1,2-epoxy-1,2-dihydrophenyl)acetyl-CoA isomerase
VAYEDITYEVADNGVAVLTLNRPDVMNAFRRQTQQEVDEALRRAEADQAVRCLVITGAGRAFSSGADLKDLAAGRVARTGPSGVSSRRRPGP